MTFAKTDYCSWFSRRIYGAQLYIDNTDYYRAVILHTWLVLHITTAAYVHVLQSLYELIKAENKIRSIWAMLVYKYPIVETVQWCMCSFIRCVWVYNDSSVNWSKQKCPCTCVRKTTTETKTRQLKNVHLWWRSQREEKTTKCFNFGYLFNECRFHAEEMPIHCACNFYDLFYLFILLLQFFLVLTTRTQANKNYRIQYIYYAMCEFVLSSSYFSFSSLFDLNFNLCEWAWNTLQLHEVWRKKNSF